MPSKKIAGGDGVKITHKFKSGDHPLAHMHVDGDGASTKIGPDGNPIKG